jgi:lipoprotein-anchoring transpeptidase ErfK/SrfK
VKRGFSIALVVLGFVVAGTYCAVALAGAPPGTTTATTLTSATPASAAPLKTVRTGRTAFISSGVRIAGVRVGGLDAATAARAVRLAFAKPIPVVVDGEAIKLEPTKFAKAYVATAVARAQVATYGDNVQLTVSVRGQAVRAFVARLGKRFDRKGAPARLALRVGRPLISPELPGHRLRQGPVVAGIVHELLASTRLPLRFKTQMIAPGLTRSDVGAVILINRSLNRLTYFDRGKMRRFAVATGQSIYPTPAGRFQIVDKWKDPWWSPPTYDSWAKGLKPVPPGPNNPLGTRWMGLSAPGVGIHGTDQPSSIGYSASHGCIRMQVPDAEWLFDHVGIGTTVFIL